MPEDVSLEEYYQAIDERGWAAWVHGMKDNFIPNVHPAWTTRTQGVSPDRQVTVAWDPTRFTDKIGDQHLMVEVYANTDYRVVLFSVT